MRSVSPSGQRRWFEVSAQPVIRPGTSDLLAVVSVDGVNVVTGETAAPAQGGYVIDSWRNLDITGWRKSDAEVAAFHFTASQASYAARTGRPASRWLTPPNDVAFPHPGGCRR